MGKIIKKGIEYGGSSNSAENINYDDTKNVKTVLDTKATKYTSKGSATQPVYIDSDGVPTPISYTVGKSVPSDAKFTDTTYGAATTSEAGLMSASDKSKLDGITSSADSVSFSRSLSSGTKIGTITINGTGTDLYCQTNTDTNTTYSAGTGLSLSGTTFSVNYGSAAGTACQGNDSRLSNARPASDVYSWAKASSKPSYSWGEITGKPSTFTPASHSHSYAGSSSAGGSATSAISVVDYGNTSKTIQIGYNGAGATTSNLTHIAGYLSGGTQIKDVSKDVLKSWLGLGSNAYNSTSYLPTSGGTLSGNLNMQYNTLQFGTASGESYGNNFLSGSNTTFNIGAPGYLNLRSSNIQCRNFLDTAWSGISASSFTNQSSRKYKKNIEDMTDEVAKSLLNYRVVSYDYINEDDGTNCLGLIAEEVAEVCEYPVIRDSEGNPDKIDYSRFVPQLIRMVQIQQNEIDYLKSLMLQNNN